MIVYNYIASEVTLIQRGQLDYYIYYDASVIDPFQSSPTLVPDRLFSEFFFRHNIYIYSVLEQKT